MPLGEPAGGLQLLAKYGWSVLLEPARDDRPAESSSRVVWRDGLGIYAVCRPQGAAEWDYLIRAEDLASATIHLATRQVVVRPAAPDIPEATLRHIWLDQILPGLLDHDGSLVLHGGAVRHHGRGIAILGPSGRGKSTLVASLATADDPALNDDGLVIGWDDGRHTVAPTYPGLRLLPDTLARLVPATTETSPVSHYATKRRVHQAGHLSATPAALAALFFLDPPGADDRITIHQMPPAQACMGLVAQSFALDPTDRARAAARMHQASELVAAVPAFSLRYPRDYDRLPEVHVAIFAAVDGTAALL